MDIKSSRAFRLLGQFVTKNTKGTLGHDVGILLIASHRTKSGGGIERITHLRVLRIIGHFGLVIDSVAVTCATDPIGSVEELKLCRLLVGVLEATSDPPVGDQLDVVVESPHICGGIRVLSSHELGMLLQQGAFAQVKFADFALREERHTSLCKI